MIRLNRFKAILQEKRFLNPYIRLISNTVYRSIFKKEGKKVKEYCNQNSSKSLIGLSLSQLYSLEHIRDLVDYLKNSERMHPVLFSTTKRIPTDKFKKNEKFEFLSSRYNIIYNRNLFAYPWLKPSKVKIFFELIISSYGYELTCPKILYTHGMGGLNFSKDLKHIRYVNRYDAIFLNGPMHKKVLYTAQKYYGGTLPKMYEIGYLRGDRLLKMAETFNRTAFLKSLDLLDVPTVMYAPTWGDFSSTSEWIDNVIDVCEDMGISLLLRIHPIMLTGNAKWKTGGIDWNTKLSDIKKRHPQVRVAMSHDIDEIMLAADILITDVSGLALEYMTLDKPVVFLQAPRYFDLYGSDRPEKWCRSENEVKNKTELKEALKRTLDGDGFKFPIDKLVYNRGKSLDTMIKSIEQILY